MSPSAEQPHQDLSGIASRFEGGSASARIRPLGNGNVNDTFLVEGSEPFVMQRLNTAVFRQPQQVMHNLLAVSRHIDHKLSDPAEPMEGRRWEMPRVIKLRHSDGHWVEAEGGFWRGISYIGAAESVDVLSSNRQALEVGYGLGRFHQLISDLPCDQLKDTLEGFHIAPGYLANHDDVCAGLERELQGDEVLCQQFIEQRRDFIPTLEQAKASGELVLRPIHGDPKVNNLMLDADSGRAIALVDLDTVKPGLVHYDIGDCLRSGCNQLGEEATDPAAVTFDLQRCEAILTGYLNAARPSLSEADFDYLFAAIRLIPLELGLRFFTDHLQGNTYFKVNHPTQNLLRAQVQFNLCASIEAQELEIRSLIQRLRS